MTAKALPGAERQRRIERGIQSPELRKAFRAARRAGWTYKVSGSTHILLHNPQGESTSISTTRHGTDKNALAKLKQMGLIIE